MSIMPPLLRQYSLYNEQEFSDDEIVFDDSDNSSVESTLTVNELLSFENDYIHENGEIVIGSYYLIKNTKYGLPIDYKWLLYLSVSFKNFLDYEYNEIYNYLKGSYPRNNLRIGILKVVYKYEPEDDDNTYYSTVVDKTIWIKLIQRTWKKIIRERKEIFRRRIISSSLMHREVMGRWPTELYYLPTLKGCLYKLKNTV
jgi:hypothetical protein